MAVSVNTVYQTVLYILNKEQRGYVTPAEFNSIADLVQKQIFQSYFPDGNQQNRLVQNNQENDTEFFNMFKDISYKLYPFEKEINFAYDTTGKFFYNGSVDTVYKIGEVISTYNGQPQYSSISQLVSKKDFDKLMDLALKAHKLMGCRGVTRSDFKFYKGRFYLLEINTQPGMTSLSLVPEIAAFYGISFIKLIRLILKDASTNK